jgi:DMSO reductase family type II enzyme heme b subunit
VDDWGKPIRPSNLTQGWNYRGWNTPRDVMLRVLTGIDGAGMPSYAGAVSPEDAWHLAYYVASLQEPPHWNFVARAAHVSGSLPQTVDDPRWETAERTDVRLRNAVSADGEWVEPPMVDAVSFQVLANDEAVAFRFTWDDPSNETQWPGDTFALVLKPEATKGDVVTLQAWPYEGAPALDIIHWMADTRVSTFETVTTDFHYVPPGPKPERVFSTAAYEDGRWKLILVRPLAPKHPAGAAVIDPEAFSSIAFAIWDGSNPGARAVSPWIDLAFPHDGQKAEH